MRRRNFIAGFGAALAWPLATQAQQPERMRRIGLLMSRAASDPEGQARVAELQKALHQVGLRDGREVQIDVEPG